MASWGSCSPLVALLAALGRSWASLGRSWGSLGRSWGSLGPVLAALGVVLDTPRRLTLQLQVRFPFWLKPLPEPATPPPSYSPWKPSAPNQVFNESWQEQQRRATEYDREFDAEKQMAPLNREGGWNLPQPFLSSGAVQPAQPAPDRSAVEPSSSRSSGSNVRSQRRVMNCSVQTAEHRQEARRQSQEAAEYNLLARMQIQAYLQGEDEQMEGV